MEMQISLDSNIGIYTIRSYQEGTIVVNDQAFHHSIILTPDELIETWKPQSFIELQKDDLQPLLVYNPEVLLLGTGAEQHFLKDDLQAFFYQHKIGAEIMNTAAACRTYNVLISEGRKVVAALLIK